jgi:hypothetical protein
MSTLKNFSNFEIAEEDNKSIYIGRTINEYPNIDILTSFITSKYGISYTDIKKYDHLKHLYKSEYEQLKRYKKLYDTNDECIKTSFKLPEHGWGRIIPRASLSLSVFRRATRHTLCNDEYIDIDMVNSQPTLIYEIAKKNDIILHGLKEYIEHRCDILDQIMNHHKCDKDTAKELILIVLNGGSYHTWLIEYNIKNCKKIDLISQIENEMIEINNIVHEYNQHIVDDIKKIDPTRWKDIKGEKKTILSLWAQTKERLLIEAVIQFITDLRDIDIDDVMPCQDGFMIRKHQFYNGLCDDINKSIIDVLDMNFKFIVKPFDKVMSLTESTNEETQDEDDDEYTKIKKQFEINNFKIMDPVSFAHIRDDGTIIRRDKRDLLIAFENIHYKHTKKTSKSTSTEDKPFINAWLKDESIRTYIKAEFMPTSNAPPTIYNTFINYKATKKEYIDVDITKSLIYAHLLHLCNNDNDVFTYVVNWLANIIQHPHHDRTSLIFKSREGSGKDTFFNWFGNSILGSEYYANETSLDLVFGRFNSIIDNKVLMILNEVSFEATQPYMEKLKGSITRLENSIEYKKQTPFTQRNNVSYVLLTNNDNPIKISSHDRRFCGIECDNSICNNREYFTALLKEMKEGTYDRAFYDYLLNINIDGYDFTRNRPITLFYESMREMNIPIIARFLDEHLIMYEKDIYEEVETCDGIINESTKYTKGEQPTIITFTGRELFDDFNKYLTDNKFKFEYTSTKFGVDIKRYDGVTSKRTRLCVEYNINVNETRQYLVDKFKLSRDNRH